MTHCNYFPYNRGSLNARCQRTNALLYDLSINNLCTRPLTSVLNHAIGMIPTASACLHWSDDDTACLVNRLTALRDHMIDTGNVKSLYDLLTTNSAQWGGNVQSLSCELANDVFLAYNYVPDRGSGRLPEPKDEIKDFFDTHGFLGVVGGSPLRFYYETPQSMVSDHAFLVIKMARKLGIFDAFNYRAMAIAPEFVPCTAAPSSCIGEGDDIMSEGVNDHCHQLVDGNYECQPKTSYNCDLTGDPPQPSSFSDACPSS